MRGVLGRSLVAQAGPETGELAMVAVYPSPEEAEALAVEGGLEAEDLHCTLVFLGDADEIDAEAAGAAVQRAVEDGAIGALEGTVGGVGHFAETADGVPVILLPDVQNLTLLRERVVSELRSVGIESPSEHGFQPHLTLEYAEDDFSLEIAEGKLGLPLTFGAVSLVVGERIDYDMGESLTAAAGEVTPADLTAATARARDRLEADVPQLAESYEAVLRAAGRRMSRAFSSASVILADARFVPPDSAEPGAQIRFLPPDEDEVAGTDKLGEEMRASASEAQRQAARDVAAALRAEGIAFDIERVFTDEMLEAVGARATFAADHELRGLYRQVVTEAAEQGWSVNRTAGAIIERVDEMAGYRAAALARTDIGGLMNGASVHVAEETVGRSEETVYKVWLATADEVTRDSHADADGQSVPVNEPFVVSGAALRFPGDPLGPDEETFNCRCTVYYTSTPGEAVVRAAVYSSDDATEEGTMSTATDRVKVRRSLRADRRPFADGNGEVVLRDPVSWNATLCVEGEATEDGRLLVPNSIAWRDLPLTLMGMIETSEWGHEGAQVSGRIDDIFRAGSDIDSTGDLTTDFGIDTLAPMIADRTVRGVSVDLAVLDYEYRDRDTGATLDDDDLLVYWLEGREGDIVFAVLEGVIVGATVCPMPAIANAEISLAASAGLGEQPRAILAAALEGRGLSVGDVPVISVFTPFDRVRSQGLFASVATFDTEAPPRSAFELTEFPGKTPLTITDDGRVFGHIATWDTCHVGIPGVCTTAPRSSTTPPYALFHQGQYPTAEGGLIDIGKLMLGTGHASLGASRMEATRHYDKPDKVGAYVRAYDGEHGIWVSGVVRPELSKTGLRELRANPPSGDWRDYQGRLELIAVCAVPIPGFPNVADAQANITAAGGEVGISALIASPGVIVPTSEVKAALIAAGCGCDDLEVSDGVDELAELSAD